MRRDKGAYNRPSSYAVLDVFDLGGSGQLGCDTHATGQPVARQSLHLLLTDHLFLDMALATRLVRMRRIQVAARRVYPASRRYQSNIVSEPTEISVLGKSYPTDLFTKHYSGHRSSPKCCVTCMHRTVIQYAPCARSSRITSRIMSTSPRSRHSSRPTKTSIHSPSLPTTLVARNRTRTMLIRTGCSTHPRPRMRSMYSRAAPSAGCSPRPCTGTTSATRLTRRTTPCSTRWKARRCTLCERQSAAWNTSPTLSSRA